MPERNLLARQTAYGLAAGLLVGLVVGFFVTNGLNRQEQERLQAELTRARAGGGGAAQSNSSAPAGGQNASAPAGAENSFPTLTDDQIKTAVARADADPSDAELQRKAGQALYYYAMQTGNASILPEVARLLKRAHELDPKDYQTNVLAGNAHFLVARGGGGDARTLTEARKLYEQALAAKSDDVVVRTSLGLTYFYDRPPDAQRAIKEFRRALQQEPRHEMPLQSLAAALIETGELTEAERRLGELEAVNKSNPELANLRAQLEQKKNAAKESR
ncbi:MAG TPA: tetratricopeptide repeat protein [Pyrinomonadaceae bacterium]|jgi:tetratricopeptide (TPR) repeat protein|nr:tetratricopeptide repeat protein [Pyrinomonadaceae bacterium]